MFYFCLGVELVALLHQLEAFLWIRRKGTFVDVDVEELAPVRESSNKVRELLLRSAATAFYFCLPLRCILNNLVIFLHSAFPHHYSKAIISHHHRLPPFYIQGPPILLLFDQQSNDVIALQQMFEEERKRGHFDQKELSYIIYGSKDQYQDYRRRQAIVDSDPILKFDPATIQRSRADLIHTYSQKLIRYSELFPPDQYMHGYKNLFFDQQLPLGLHESMFLITLRNLCDPHQQKTILEPAVRGEILGCYAQTELGHGSDIQGLMTTATYESESQTFVLNTPEAKAAKWWIGNLGLFCTHACVFAQLIIKGKKHGVHAFVVPIRDKDHKPFPGLQVGDIGPKMGFQTMDNGYLIFKNYRIGREMMLMKYHKVSADGTYKVTGNQKITYATMLMIRAQIPFLSFAKTSKAIVILTRYSLYRRQFKDNKGQQMPIIDYQLQQEKLFPRIAEVFANLFAFKSILELAKAVLNDANNNTFDRLQEAHVISSSIKALTTKDGLRGLQILRRAAGGHGFSSYSGIPGLQNQLAPSFTYEGQYTILQLQVARFLLKSVDRALNGKSLSDSVAYIGRLSQSFDIVDTDNEQELLNPKRLVRLFEMHSLERIKKAAERIQKGMQKGMKLKNSWDQYSGLELVDAATAHGYHIIVKYNQGKIEQLSKDPQLKEVLTNLFRLYAVQKISQYSLSFFQTKVLGATSLRTYRSLREKLLARIRPNALNIVEAFSYSDNVLHTALGRSDGKAYSTLLDWAKNNNDINAPKFAEEIRREALGLKQETMGKIKARL